MPMTLEIPTPSDPVGPVVPDAPTVPADPVPGPEAPDTPSGPDTPPPDDPLPPAPDGPDVPPPADDPTERTRPRRPRIPTGPARLCRHPASAHVPPACERLPCTGRDDPCSRRIMRGPHGRARWG